MNAVTQEKTFSTAEGLRLAQLGAASGYRFDGDTVHLNAMFTVVNPAAHQRMWALQLRACPVAPGNADEINGHLVAEVALPPIGEVADDTESFETFANACLPAGQVDHAMVLVLASGSAGRFDEVHDFAVFPRRERFLQPRIAGNVGFRIENGRVTLEVGRIENPRDASNLSGTLALELWALTGPYRSGGFSGVPLAGVAFDPLSGQCEYRQRSFDLRCTPPPAGTWNLTLMLREWTAAGFVTRDFTNFATPMTVAAPAAAVAAKAPKLDIAPVRTLVTPPPVATTPQSKAKRQPAVAPSVPVKGLVSINSATKQELATVKGLPAKVVEGIVSKRPFKSLDELMKIKGMGARLFAKVRSKLKL